MTGAGATMQRQAAAGRTAGAEISEEAFSLFTVMLLLLTVGLLMMTSASIETASSQYGDPFYFLKRQLFFLLPGGALMLATLCLPVRFWYSASFALLLLSIFLLTLVLVPGIGKVVNGSARWIDLGFYNLQPSEFAKPFIVIYFAAYLQRRREEIVDRWVGFIKPILILIGVVALLHFEPDHGAMVILTLTTFCMIFLAGARLQRFVVVLLLCIAGVVGLAVTKPYVIDRFTSFLNPWAAEYVYGDGYQLTQALIAFGRGEWLGVGLGNSIQKLYFLPEAHTDFVFAIVAEETGLVGASLVVALFVVLVYRAFRIGRRAERQGELFSAWLAYGLALLFAGQALINLGVNIGLLPTKGLTLPFLSYGGNSLVASLFMVGLLLRIQYECAEAPGPGRRKTAARGRRK